MTLAVSTLKILKNFSGKEKSRDTCLVITLEARIHDELQTIARNHINMWIKANICPRDLEKKARRLPKGGAAQPSRSKKRKLVKCNRCGHIHDCNPGKKYHKIPIYATPIEVSPISNLLTVSCE